MFDFISNLLTNIANFFSSVWDFIINIIKDIVFTVKILGDVVGNIGNYFTWLPQSVLAILVLAIAIVVIYKVMGREG